MTAPLSVLALAASLFAPPSTPAAPALCANAPSPIAPIEAAVKSLCVADCGTFYPDVSCNGTICNAVNRSCSSEQGHVTCDGTTFYCPVCCTDGQIKLVSTGPICSCPDGMTSPKDRYKCIGGEWVYQESICGGPFCHG